MTDSEPGAALAPVNPIFMLQSMIDRGADPDSLGKMMDLAERWKKQQAEEAYNRAMNACQKEMPTVVRDKKNNETNKGYAPVETVQTYTKPVYIRHGFSLSFSSDTGSEPGLSNVHLDVMHVDGHTRRHTLPNVPLDDKGPKGGAVKTLIQGLMSSMSYAQGRLIRLAFNITVADEDRDGQMENISPKQIETINELIEKCGEAGRPIDFVRFKAWLDIAELDQMPLRKYPLALDELNRKLKGK